MVKTIVFFSLSLITLQSYSMNSELQPLVAKARKITVHTHEQTDIQVSIDDKTTVLQVKKSLQALGIPVDEKSLYPLFKTWKHFWIGNITGDKLTDNQNIKKVMDKHSDRFLLMPSDLSKSHK